MFVPTAHVQSFGIWRRHRIDAGPWWAIRTDIWAFCRCRIDRFTIVRVM